MKNQEVIKQLSNYFTLKFEIEGEGGVNEEASKNTAIRNFIERKSSNDLVKISTKKHKKYKGSLST